MSTEGIRGELTVPDAIASLPADREQWLTATQQHQVAVALCDRLEIAIPEHVAGELLRSGNIPPEIFILIEEGLVGTMVKVRRLLLSAKDVPQIAMQAREAAVQLLFEHFAEVRDVVQEVIGLNYDVTRSMHLLGQILSAKNLSSIPDEKLAEGLVSIGTLQKAEGRILLQMVARWAADMRDQGIDFRVDHIETEPSEKGTRVSIPYTIPEGELKAISERATQHFASLPGFEVSTWWARHSKGGGGGEAHFTDSGELQLTFQRNTN